MPFQDFIDVRIVVDGKPLEEYQAPNQTPDPSHTMTRYIEVKTGQIFEVHLKFMVGFHLRKAEYLSYEVRFDNAEGRSSGSVNVQELQNLNGILLEDSTSILIGKRIRDESTGDWNRFRYTFGALGIDDNMDTEISPQSLSGLGSIRVTCFRADLVPRKTPRRSSSVLEKPLDALPEKAMKGRDLKNIVQYTIGGPVPEPEVRLHKCVLRDNEEVYRFILLYRCRKALQSLGCIPRSPSPPPDTGLMLTRTEDMLKRIKERERMANLEILRLRERLEQLQAAGQTSSIVNLEDAAPTTPAALSTSTSTSASTGQKTGTTSHRSSAAVKLEPATPGPPANANKRGRDADEEELEEVAPPPQKPRVEIDLTDD